MRVSVVGVIVYVRPLAEAVNPGDSAPRAPTGRGRSWVEWERVRSFEKKKKDRPPALPV